MENGQMNKPASSRVSRQSTLRNQSGEDEMAAWPRAGSRGASRGGSRGGSRGPSRGPSRGASRGTSRGRSRGLSVRPSSSVSHFSLTFAADYADFQRAAEASVPAESELLCLEGALTSDDLTSGVSEYLQECARLDVGPRARVVTQLRANNSTLDLANVQLGPRGARCLTPIFKHLGFVRAASFQGCGLGPEGFRVVVEGLCGRVVQTEASAVSPLLPQLERLDFARNLIGARGDLVLKPGIVMPCLPEADYEFAREQRRKLLAYQHEDPRERQARLEAQKNDKEAEFVPVSTTVFGLGQRLPRPYLAPVSSEKGQAGKAPEIPAVVPLETRYGIAKKIDSLGLEHVSVTGLCLECLGGFTQLTSLNLSFNRLGDENMAHLASAITSCPALQELSIAGNQIGSKGLYSILGAAADSKIETLNLAENRIDATGAALLASFLALKN